MENLGNDYKNASNVGYRCLYFSVLCTVGSSTFPLPLQEYLRGKCIKFLFLAGNATPRGGGAQPVLTTDFWVDLKRGQEIYLQLSAEMLDFNVQNQIKFDMRNIDFQNSQLIFPANIAVESIVEFVVFYEDLPNPM